VEVFCVVGMQEMRIPTLKCRFHLCVGWGTCTYTGSKGSFFRCLEVLEGTFVRTYMRQSCLGCIFEVFCVVGLQEMRIPTIKCRCNLFVGWGTCTYTGSKRVVFSVFGGFGGDFCKETYEPKMVGMNSGRVQIHASKTKKQL